MKRQFHAIHRPHSPYLGDGVSELLVGLQQHGIREGAGDGGGGVQGRELRGQQPTDVRGSSQRRLSW